MRIVYDPEVDALHIWLQETTVTTKELAEGVSADYDRNGQLAESRSLTPPSVWME